MAVLKHATRRIALLVTGLALAIGAGPTVPALAQTTGAIERGPSGLPLPRFVSLKASRVNLRIGPGSDYAVDWLYLRRGLPLEIIQEYDNWRRVRDAEGTEGWIYQSLLTGTRTGMAAPWLKEKEATITLRGEPREAAKVLALVEPGAIGDILTCNGKWCRMRFERFEGWVEQSAIWGIYPGETYKR
jgi:SH3-like domain-containing protein